VPNREQFDSEPLSQRITNGLPRHSMILSSDQITRAAGSDRSASMPPHD
jgi:hypothetical protein